jgi:hypothetical protein
MRKRNWNKHMALQIMVLLFACSSYGSGSMDRSIDSLTSEQAAEKIESLKKDLAHASGSKRTKIMKKIAEIENRILEKKKNAGLQR